MGTIASTFSTGSTSLYHDAAADINLLELDGTDFESSYDIYFVGWSISTSAPASGATFGFPDDKPLQISIENDPITDCAPGGCPDGFGADFWRVEHWDVGVTEGGSSGGALLNEDNLLVGVLTGGVGTDCTDFQWDEYAKIEPVWTSLKPFLDPDETGLESIPGKDGLEVPEVPALGSWSRSLLIALLLVCLPIAGSMRSGSLTS